MPLLLDDLDVGIVLFDRRLEGIVALAGDKEVGGVVDDADLTFAAERLGHEVRGGDAVSVVVRRDDADVVLAGREPLRHVVHEDELHTLVGSLPVGRGGGDRVGRDRDDDVRVAGKDRLDVRDLRLRLEAASVSAMTSIPIFPNWSRRPAICAADQSSPL